MEQRTQVACRPLPSTAPDISPHARIVSSDLVLEPHIASRRNIGDPPAADAAEVRAVMAHHIRYLPLRLPGSLFCNRDAHVESFLFVHLERGRFPILARHASSSHVSSARRSAMASSHLFVLEKAPLSLVRIEVKTVVKRYSCEHSQHLCTCTLVRCLGHGIKQHGLHGLNLFDSGSIGVALSAFRSCRSSQFNYESTHKTSEAATSPGEKLEICQFYSNDPTCHVGVTNA